MAGYDTPTTPTTAMIVLSAKKVRLCGIFKKVATSADLLLISVGRPIGGQGAEADSRGERNNQVRARVLPIPIVLMVAGLQGR
jgi:hypothetical protein